MLTAQHISLTLGDKIIFDDASFNINHDQRIGLIGRNGSGKSTLLKVINGSIPLDSGSLNVEKRYKVAYFPQEVVLVSTKSILDETMMAFGYVLDLKAEYEQLKTYCDNNPNPNPDKVERFSEVMHRLADINEKALLIKTKKILLGLGFDPKTFDQPVSTLSVGWKMRLVLAKLLLQDADFYLFDEPTNHLDIIAKDWFLDFLKNARFGFVLVSHDRFFLDHLCEYILELDRGHATLFHGNYEEFTKHKELETAAQQAAYEAQQRVIKQKQRTIDRFRAKASKASMAQSMIKSLERIELIEAPEANQKTITLQLPPVKRTGDIVLHIKGVSKTFNEKVIFDHANFDLFRGDKAALVAANGKGKTSLLNLITGKYHNEHGTIKFGHNVEWAFFEQDQETCLDKNKTVLEEAESVCTSSEMRQRVRGLLGSFLFPGDDVEKKIAVLSGGEKNRVAMVKVLLLNANFLILDEPTNHLDIQSKEILLHALQQYQGTILFVSHDRSFLDQLATKIFELTEHGIVTYKGNYEDYLYYKQQREKMQNQPKEFGSTKQKTDTTNKQLSDGKQEYELRKKIGSLERKIESLDQELLTLNQKFDQLTYGTDAFEKNMNRIKQIQNQLKECWAQWEEAQMLLDK